MDLLHGCHRKNHLLYVDNFYTSPELLLDLLKIGVYCTGTVRTNRKHFPKELVPADKSMGMGTYRFASCENFPLTAVWWKDRRDVFVLSYVHEKAGTETTERFKGEDKHTVSISDSGL